MQVATVSAGCHRKAGGFFLVRAFLVSPAMGSSPAFSATLKIFAILPEVLSIAGILNYSTRPQKIKHSEESSRSHRAFCSR
jgi:hypothetical protein